MAGSGMAALQWFLQVRKMAPVWKRRRAGFSEMQARQGTKSQLSLCSSLASLAMPGQRTPGSFPGSGVRAREDWSGGGGWDEKGSRTAFPPRFASFARVFSLRSATSCGCSWTQARACMGLDAVRCKDRDGKISRDGLAS